MQNYGTVHHNNIALTVLLLKTGQSDDQWDEYQDPILLLQALPVPGHLFVLLEK